MDSDHGVILILEYHHLPTGKIIHYAQISLSKMTFAMATVSVLWMLKVKNWVNVNVNCVSVEIVA